MARLIADRLWESVSITDPLVCPTCEGKQVGSAHLYDPDEYDGPCPECGGIGFTDNPALEMPIQPCEACSTPENTATPTGEAL